MLGPLVCTVCEQHGLIRPVAHLSEVEEVKWLAAATLSIGDDAACLQLHCSLTGGGGGGERRCRLDGH